MDSLRRQWRQWRERERERERDCYSCCLSAIWHVSSGATARPPLPPYSPTLDCRFFRRHTRGVQPLAHSRSGGGGGGRQGGRGGGEMTVTSSDVPVPDTQAERAHIAHEPLSSLFNGGCRGQTEPRDHRMAGAAHAQYVCRGKKEVDHTASRIKRTATSDDVWGGGQGGRGGWPQVRV